MKHDTKNVDLIIVGGGLAGCCLAWNAIFKGLSVVIIDNADKNVTSNIAAGLFNPITGRTFQKSWQADTLFPFLDIFYKRVEAVTKSRFLFHLNILKPFWNKQEYDLCNRSNTLDYDFIDIIRPGIDFMNFGGIKINKSGFLDVKKFLTVTKEFLSRGNMGKTFFIKADFDYKDITIKDDIIIYKTSISEIDFIGKSIVFCEGVYGCFNPFFTDLNFRPVLGEILDVQLSKHLNDIYNRDVFILSKSDKVGTIGSTYKRLDPSDKGSFTYDKYTFSKLTFNKSPKNIISELEAVYQSEEVGLMFKANRLLKAVGEECLPQVSDIIKRKVGLRPCTLNRRPILKVHPKYLNMAIFNGLGAKGVSLAPYFSNKILNMLVHIKVKHEL